MQTFFLVPTEVMALRMTDPTASFECACASCRKMTNIFDGKVFEFNNGQDWQYRLFCSFEDALATMDPRNMEQA